MTEDKISEQKEIKDFITDGEGRYKIWWDDEGKMIRVIVCGVMSGGLTEKMIEDTKKIIEQRGGKINCLADLSGITKSLASSRKVARESMRNLLFNKVALVGVPVLISAIAGFVFRAAGKNETLKFFKTEREALEWLKEQ